MLAYKLNMIHVQNDVLNHSPIRHDKNVYTRAGKIHSGGFCTPIRDELCLWLIIATDNTSFRRNRIPTIRDSVISYIHIGCAKHGIYSSEKDNTTGITIQKLI